MKRSGIAIGVILCPVLLTFVVLTTGSTVAAKQNRATTARPMPFDRAIGERRSGNADSAAFQDAYLYRFDPELEAFETFTIPTESARPHSIAAMPRTVGQEVWFTEPGADQIGRLVYTSTGVFALDEFPVGAGSEPYNLVVDDGRRIIWFTERSSNRIGGLFVGSGHAPAYVSFTIPTADSEPTDIDLAPNGSVWFTEMAADNIGQLVATSPTDGVFAEYQITGTGEHVGAYAIAVQSDDYVWFSEINTGVIKRLRVADPPRYLWVSQLGRYSYPHALVVDNGRFLLWLTARHNNQLSHVELGTLFIVNQFDIEPNTAMRPTGLTLLNDDELWFSGQGSGQIGRMVYTSPTQFEFDLYELQYDDLWAMDITSTDDGALWVVAYSPMPVSLPVVLKHP
jgi:virginiamycin B lyase